VDPFGTKTRQSLSVSASLSICTSIPAPSPPLSPRSPRNRIPLVRPSDKSPELGRTLSLCPLRKGSPDPSRTHAPSLAHAHSTTNTTPHQTTSSLKQLPPYHRHLSTTPSSLPPLLVARYAHAPCPFASSEVLLPPSALPNSPLASPCQPPWSAITSSLFARRRSHAVTRRLAALRITI
ncbi:hypothetical protein K402DRAFT_448242, partial [Aulographum hederae CBS 113979]